MILEPEYTVTWEDASLGVTVGSLPLDFPPPKVAPKRIQLELPLAEPPPPEAGAPYRITYERCWKILGLKESDLQADIDRLLRESKPVEPAPKESTAPPRPHRPLRGS
jgi:hypothetical protein